MKHSQNQKGNQKNYILAIDQGTTGTTAILVDVKNFHLRDKITQEFPQIFPRPGEVEHDLNAIWETVRKTVQSLLDKNKVDPQEVACIGLTNQRETTCAFNRQGTPLSNAIVWQDRRTVPFCQKLKDQGKEEWIKKKTGLTIDPYFSATKMNWLLQNQPQVKNAKDLCLGTMDTFLLFKLTGHRVFATEASNASRTLLMDLQKGEWDRELTDIFQVSPDSLPEIKDSFTHFGETAGLDFLPDGIPITGILGDQQSALLGQAGLSPGDMKCTYGTGAFVLLNTGKNMTFSRKGLLTTIAYQHQGERHYALEGSSYIAGAAVQWLRDNLKFFKKSSEVEERALKVVRLSEMEHVLFMPFFTGIGSPHWLPEAKGAILGLTRDTQQDHLSRACLEGIALSINDLLDAFQADFPNQIPSLRVDGGAAADNLLLQLQSNFSELSIIRPQIIETTAYGAALAAAIGAGLLDLKTVKTFWKEEKTFHPEKEEEKASYYQRKRKKWKEAITRLYLPN